MPVVPYELVVEIQNAGEAPALYASLDLDVGADAYIGNCSLDTNGVLNCEEVESPVTRTLGHLLPAQKVRETFTVVPLVEGQIASCVGFVGSEYSVAGDCWDHWVCLRSLSADEGRTERYPNRVRVAGCECTRH